MAANALTPIARRIRSLMIERDLSQKALARQAKVNETYVRDILEGRSKNPHPDKLKKVAGVLGCSVAYLIGEMDERHVEPSRESALPQLSIVRDNGRGWRIAEMDIRASAGPGALVDSETKVAEWEMPRDLIRTATDSLPQQIKIITIVGDSMEPLFRLNEKVMVDTGDKTPTPPGVFVVWDGLGLVAKRVEHIPFSEPPAVKISSENPKYGPYERVLDEAYIQGRVLGKWLWT